MSKDNGKHGFGIIGTGLIAHFHAKAIAAIPNAELVGAYNINYDKAAVFSQEHGAIAYSSLNEMLDNNEIDVVCICTPSGAHLEPAVQCIEAGKHCLIEKPLEITLDRCDRIIGAAEKAGVKVGVIFPSRFAEVNQQLKQAITTNRFGDFVLGDAYVKWHRTPAYYLSGKWRGSWQYDGGGAMMNQGIHAVDLLQWLMGPVKTVSAFASNIKHKNIEVEDTIVAALKFANGALGTIECTTAAFPGALKRIEIIGTSGSVVIEENNIIQWQFEKEIPLDYAVKNNAVNKSSGGAADPAAINFQGHQKQIEDMLDAIQNDSPLFIDAKEGRKSVEIILAAYKSAASGEAVRLS